MTLEDRDDLVNIFKDISMKYMTVATVKETSRDKGRQYRERSKVYAHAAMIVDNFYAAGDAVVKELEE